VVDHEMGHLVDRDMGPERARTRTHDLLDRLVAAPLKLLSPKQTQDDALTVNDHARVPSRRSHALQYLADRLVEATRRDIPPRHVAGARTRRGLALGRKAGGEPVELAGGVVVDLRESEALEPPRGPWTEISGRVPAVDDDGRVLVEFACRLRLDLAQGQVDRAREVVLFEFLAGQDLHDLRPHVHQLLQLVALKVLHSRLLPDVLRETLALTKRPRGRSRCGRTPDTTRPVVAPPPRPWTRWVARLLPRPNPADDGPHPVVVVPQEERHTVARCRCTTSRAMASPESSFALA